MNTEVVKVLKSWKSSLDHYEKLDDWKLSANLSVLGAYLRTKDENAIMGSVLPTPMIPSLFKECFVMISLSSTRMGYAHD